RHRLKAQKHLNSVLIDLLFKLVDLFVIDNGMGAKIIVPLEQSFNRAFQASLGQAGHHEHIVAQRPKRFVKRPENMSWCDHPIVESFVLLFLWLLLDSASTKSTGNIILRSTFAWIRENFSGRPKLDQPAEVKERGAIGAASRLLHVVSHDHNGVLGF